jgi:UDP-N-acetyl-D-mannosaminuronic acid transferase (WecB/TagA/CpsF family)
MKHYRQEAGMNLIANFAVLASRRAIFDLPVCDLGWDDALVFINELLSVPVGQTSISFVNAHNMLMTLRDSEYRAILWPEPGVARWYRPQHRVEDCPWLAVPGQPERHGFRAGPADIHGAAAPHRVDRRQARGGRACGRELSRHAPWHEFIVISDGYFDKDDASDVVAEIERRKPDILIVGMGTPLQEKWAYHTIRSDHARLVLTVGALFDFVSGTVPRAPKIVRAMRLEWAYRLVQEPARLWRRYVIGIPLFLYFVLQYRFSRRARILKRSA